jgi:hypothetical protein
MVKNEKNERGKKLYTLDAPQQEILAACRFRSAYTNLSKN